MSEGFDPIVEWRDVPPVVRDGTVALIVEALLPLAMCPDVVVRRAVEQKLTVVERFLIEVALELGDLAIEDVEELIGPPAEATERIAGHLCDMHVLRPADGRYKVVEETARAALAREVLVEYRESHLMFLVLPRAGDVLAFEHRKGHRAPPMIDRLQPVGRAPVPEPFRSTPLVELLGQRVQEPSVAALPKGVVDVVRVGAADWLDQCPVYRCTAELRRRAGEMRAQARLYGERGGEVSVDLSDAGGVVDHWLQQADLLDDPTLQRAAASEVGLAGDTDVTVRRRGPVEWVFALDADQARHVADQGRSLGWGGGLEILGIDRTTKTAAAVTFSPANVEAVHVFAAEDVVDRLVDNRQAPSPTVVADAVVAACTAFGVTADGLGERTIRERLWQRGRQDIVYGMRADEDFAYA